MKSRFIIAAITSLFVSQAFAQEAPHHNKWNDLSDAQKKETVEKNMERRHEHREIAKEKLEKMTPEEREKAKAEWKEKHAERKAERKEKFDKLPPEKKEQVKKNMAERKTLREQIRKEHGAK